MNADPSAAPALVLVMGPFPPPVHGLAVVNMHLAEAYARHAQVRRFDVVGSSAGEPTWAQRLGRAGALARLVLRLAFTLRRERPSALVIGGSAGGAMLLDTLAAQLARGVGVPVVLHHHSWAYLMPDSTRRYHHWGLSRLRHHRHVVLCDAMAQALSLTWDIPPERIRVLSNAAWVPTAPVPTRRDPHGVGALTLGFLSNVVRSKGIDDYLDLLEHLQAAGHPVRGLIAGPVDPVIAASFEARLSALRDVDYIGPVGTDAKAAFFGRVDLLVLPSRHVHESEPLVALEALSHGVPALCTRRGCLPTAWADGAAVHVVDEHDFVAQALGVLGPWLVSPSMRERWALAASTVHAQARGRARAQLDVVLADVLGTGASGPSPPDAGGPAP